MHPNRRCPCAPQEIKLRTAYYKASARLLEDDISTLACCKAKKRLTQVAASSWRRNSGELQAVCYKARGVAAASRHRNSGKHQTTCCKAGGVVPATLVSFERHAEGQCVATSAMHLNHEECCGNMMRSTSRNNYSLRPTL